MTKWPKVKFRYSSWQKRTFSNFVCYLVSSSSSSTNRLASRRQLKTWVYLGDRSDRLCVHLRWHALTLVEIKFARKSTQDFHRFATQPKSTQVQWNPFVAIATDLPMKCRGLQDGDQEMFFVFDFLIFLFTLAIRRTSQRKVNYLRLLATTCESVWAGLEILDCDIRIQVKFVVIK